MRRIAVVCFLFAFAALSAANATTLWSQLWGTTPITPPAMINGIIVYADTHTGLEFGDALTDFNISGWTSLLINPWEVEAWGTPTDTVFDFNVNFGSPANAAGYVMFEYLYNGQLVAPETGPNPEIFYYNGGNGESRGPVTYGNFSWPAQDPDFGKVPESGTAWLVGLGLLLWQAPRLWRRVWC